MPLMVAVVLTKPKYPSTAEWLTYNTCIQYHRYQMRSQELVMAHTSNSRIREIRGRKFKASPSCVVAWGQPWLQETLSSKVVVVGRQNKAVLAPFVSWVLMASFQKAKFRCWENNYTTLPIWWYWRSNLQPSAWQTSALPWTHIPSSTVHFICLFWFVTRLSWRVTLAKFWRSCKESWWGAEWWAGPSRGCLFSGAWRWEWRACLTCLDQSWDPELGFQQDRNLGKPRLRTLTILLIF